MSINLSLTPELEAQLTARASERGVAPAALALSILHASLGQPATTDPPGDSLSRGSNHECVDAATIALFRRWQAEDATDDPEELARREHEWTAFRDSVNATRSAAGGRAVHP